MHFLEDIGLPHVLDPRHASETFFFIFENDFRFYAEGCMEAQEWLKRASEENYDAAAFFDDTCEKRFIPARTTEPSACGAAKWKLRR